MKNANNTPVVDPRIAELEAKLAETEARLKAAEAETAKAVAAAKPAPKMTRIRSVVEEMVATGKVDFDSIKAGAQTRYGKANEKETLWAFRQVAGCLDAGLTLPKAADKPAEGTGTEG